MSVLPLARNKVRLICGVLLLLLGLLLVVVWFSWLGPLAQSLRFDELVNAGRNSPAWWEVHYRASRIHWQHDDFENVGLYATKEEVPWIIDTGPPGEDFGSCQGGHRAAALEYITNQSPGARTKEAWQQWWKEHHDKSQNRWIMDGFAQQGIIVTFPVPRATKLELLRTVGRLTPKSLTEQTDEQDKAKPLRYNALRLLRDDEFDPASVTVQELTDDTTGHLMKGLATLAGFREANPIRNGVGVVFAGEDKIDPIRINPIVYWLPWIWLTFAGLCLWGGMRLLRQPVTFPSGPPTSTPRSGAPETS
jgi:hypothetical protein